MVEPISEGTVLIRENALFPRSMQVDSQPYSQDWRQVAPPDRAVLDRQIADSGWNFFYLAGEIKAMAFGEDEPAVRRAVERILTRPETEQFNCMEITSSKTRRFLGLSYVTLTAHARHFQDGYCLLKPRWSAKIGQAVLASS